jgi:type IV pilus assembly protein PilX
MNTLSQIQKQQGAALIVGLILLVVITILAVSGMNTATTELAMARNDQNYENAFQAAETGLENALAQSQFTTLAGTTDPITKNINDYDSVSAQIDFEESTLVPDRAFSLGVGSGVSAYHFLATSTAKSQRAGVGATTTDRDSAAVHTQAFYVVGPESSTL